MAKSKEKLVAKFGTKCVVDGGAIDQVRVTRHAKRYAQLLRNHRLGIVSSGSRGVGIRRVKQLKPDLLKNLDERVFAGVGSSGAYGAWEYGFGQLGVLTLQLMATAADMDREREGKSLVEVYDNCVDNGIVPVFNILDVLDRSKNEIGKIEKGTDNDFAAEQLSRNVGARTLMLLTAKVAGVLVDGEVQPTVSVADLDDLKPHLTETDEEGTGSMLGKVQAGAKALTEEGSSVERVFIGSSSSDPREILAGHTGTEMVQ